MATHQWNEKYDQRSSRRTQGSRVFTRVYQDETSERVSEAEVLAFVESAASGAPNITLGTPHPDPAGAGTVVTDIACEDEAADGKSWKVTVTWSTPQFGPISDNPLLRPVEFEWSSETGQESVARDQSTPPREIVNSAGLPFDSMPVRDVAYVQVQMVRNETVDFFRRTVLPLMGYIGYAVNSFRTNIDGIPVDAARVRVLVRTAPKIIEGAITFYRVTYVFQLRNGLPGYEADGWRERYLDRGHYALDGGELAPILDNNGQIVQDAYPLDGSGGAAATATIAPAVLGPFRLYKEVDFGELRLA